MSESVLGDTEGNKKNLSIHCSVDPGVFFHKSEEKARRRIENVIGIVGFSFLCETQKILKRRTNPTAATTTTSTSIFGDKKNRRCVTSTRCVRIYSKQIWSHRECCEGWCAIDRLIPPTFRLVETETGKKAGRKIYFRYYFICLWKLFDC